MEIETNSMTKPKDIPGKERWPTLYRWLKRSFKISAVILIACGVPWMVLAFGFNGLPVTDSKTTISNGVQTVVSTQTTNLLASQIIGIIMWPAVVAGVYLLYGGILIGPRLLSFGEGEVEE